MNRIVLLIAVVAMMSATLVCKKSGGTSASGASGGTQPGASKSSSDDDLGREWVRTLNAYAEVIEKKGTSEERRAASAKWEASKNAIMALPNDRIRAIEAKFKPEITAAEARLKKAQENR